MNRTSPRPEPPEPDDDRFRVVAGHAAAEVRDKGSRFLADCFGVASEDAVRRRVTAVVTRHHDATHHAWALRLGHGDASISRAHDDGEPPGTAGAPILAAIDGRGLTGTLVVVTRWFGGVKLGTAGLARCYGAAAAAALDRAGFRDRYREVRVAFRVAHGDLPAAQRVIYGAGGSFTEEAYGADARLTASVRRSRGPTVRRALIEVTSGRVQFLEEGP